MNSIDVFFLLIVIGSIPLPAIIHIFFTRVFRVFTAPAARQKGPLAGGVIGLLLLMIFLYLWFNVSGETSLWPGIYALAVYLLFSYVYFHFFNMSETARRIRILVESSRSPVVDQSEFSREYTPEKMIAVRLERLLSLGELTREGEYYFQGRGILILPAFIISAIHNFLFPADEN